MKSGTIALVAAIMLGGCVAHQSSPINIRRDFAPDLPETHVGSYLPRCLEETVVGADPFFLWSRDVGTFAAILSDSDGEVLVAVKGLTGGIDGFSSVKSTQIGDDAWAKRVAVLRDSDTYFVQFTSIYRVESARYDEFAVNLVRRMFRKNLEQWTFQLRYS
jgi:hypothetical protein